MRITKILLLAVALILMASIDRRIAGASNLPCGPYQGADGSATACQPALSRSTPVSISPAVPFVWLRAAPASNGGVTAVVTKGMLLVVGDASWDGYQWWYRLTLVDTSYTGWAEQASLVETPNVTQPQGPARIRRGLPFVWVRASASSKGIPVATILPGGTYTVVGSLVFDAETNQYWQGVIFTTGGKTYTGWVEQSSVARI